MSSRSIFSLRVARCPACHARLPLHGKETMVVCEYCDARIELRREVPKPQPPSSPPRHVARSSYSGFAVAMVVTAAVGIGAASMLASRTIEGLVDSVQSWTPPTPPSPPPVATPAPPSGGMQVSTLPSSPSSSSPTVRPPSTTTTPTEPSKPKTTPSKPTPAPSGPVISVAEAKAQLEPKVLRCMGKQGTHSLLAYMGNSTAGPVTVLKDSRTRVDGKRTSKLSGTALGRCMNEAGATVRTRAVKSNYVRLELRNDAVPNPLASLPAKVDRAAIGATIATVEPKVKACAVKHGQEGAREVFYFVIDGPAGDVISVRGSYASKSFRSCAESVYRTLKFDRVQEYEVKYTHAMDL